MTNDTRRLKLLIVGFDGATFDNLGPWIEQGRLPNLASLLARSTHGRLRSTLPPVTAPAWTSFMTGKNPGKHGLYHFIEPQPNGYGPRYTNARSRRAPTLWRLLSEAGLRVGVVNVPMTYPPEAVEGFVVAGMDAPENSREITHPPDLYQELMSRFGAVSKQIRYLGYLNSDERREALLRDMADMDEHYLKLVRYLLEAHPVDAAMLVFTSTDTVQHFFFQYSDPSHPQYDAKGAERFEDAILGVYQRLDRTLGELLSELPQDASLLLMSDHGFRATSGRVVHFNRFFEEQGWLARTRPGPLRRITRPVMKRLDGLLRSSLSPRQKAWLADLLPALRHKWEARYAGFADIDWARTKVYCYEVLTFPPGIWINVKGQRPQGIVSPGDEYETLLAEVTQRLLDLRDPGTGRSLIERVYRREEIYAGPQLAHAPDLTVDWWEGITFLSKPGFGEGDVVEYLADQPLLGGDWGGGHALQGICALHGPAFRSGGRLSEASILDLAPTLLHLLGQPVPDDMDGRVLLEAFTEEFAAAHPVRTRRGPADGDGPGGGDTYTQEETEQVAERLRALGYLG